MLSRIKDFWLQPTEKPQQSHLYHFLGCCAILNDHCPRLKPTLGMLYDIVAKKPDKPFAFSQRHKDAFKEAKSQLLDLQPYHLPSDDPSYRTEIATDASGGLQGPNGEYLETGNWAAVLGQRKGIPNPIFNEGFELLQCTGVTFSKEQGKWPIPVKEMKAIQLAFVKFGAFIRLRHCYTPRHATRPAQRLSGCHCIKSVTANLARAPGSAKLQEYPSASRHKLKMHCKKSVKFDLNFDRTPYIEFTDFKAATALVRSTMNVTNSSAKGRLQICELICTHRARPTPKKFKKSTVSTGTEMFMCTTPHLQSMLQFVKASLRNFDAATSSIEYCKSSGFGHHQEVKHHSDASALAIAAFTLCTR